MRLARRLTVRVATTLLACSASIASLGAQQAASAPAFGVSAGSHVRIATPGAEPFVGTLLRASADTLVVELPSGSSLALPQARITQLDVSSGVRRHTWPGVAIGFLAGAGIGTVVALATYHRSDCGDSAIGQGIVCPLLDYASRDRTVLEDAALGVTAGTIVGALIGHVGRETWIPVSGARVGGVRARIEVRRVARLIGLGAALDF